MQQHPIDFALISKAIQSTLGRLEEEGLVSGQCIDCLEEAEKNLSQALSYHYQNNQKL
ncbi:hypothetical protein [Peribacillus sp. SCS-37]|uniref:hypothetical protein n=1 Tax=Paraperibacillus esterisolvens TaxID=3115296 RepID=UPI00390665D6